MDQADRDRLVRIETKLDGIFTEIHGDSGLVKRLNGHGTRLGHIEKVMYAAGVLGAVGGFVIYGLRDFGVEWLKRKVFGGSH